MKHVYTFFLLTFIFTIQFPAHGQLAGTTTRQHINLPFTSLQKNLKVKTRTAVMLIGIQRGKYTFLELGHEHRWTKIKLVHQPTFAIGGTMEYNFGHNILGYKLHSWYKVGRINLTYGLNLCYLTDFDHSRFGGGPMLGFRLLGFHLVNGYNFTTGNSEFSTYNKFYISLRYNIPLRKKIKIKKKK